MRRSLVYVGLLSLLACGVKGPPRPPESKDKVEEQAPPVPGTEAGSPWEEQNVLEEKLYFEEGLR